jgi:hypothetical protein
MFEIGERAVVDIGKMDNLEPIKLLGKARQFDLDPLERKAARLVHRVLRDLRDITRELAKRLLGRNKRIYAL